MRPYGVVRSILVIDRDVGLADGLRYELAAREREGRVRHAAGSQTALDELRQTRFDAAVCTLEGSVDGDDVLAHVLAQAPTTIRIALAADRMDLSARAANAHRLLPRSASAATVLDVVDRCCELQRLLVEPAVVALVGSIGTLPSLPRVYAELSRRLADPEVRLVDLARVVERDVGISAQILRMANSALFGLPQRIATIEQSLQRLGTNALSGLVLASEILRCFTTGGASTRRALEEVQEHSLSTARIARQLPRDRSTAEAAFTAALLHDVGKLVLLARIPEEFLENVSRASDARRPLHEVEKERWGVSHAEIGAHLLALWGLPGNVVEAVAHHHDPLRVPHDAFEPLDAVHVANHLALGARPGAEPSPDALLDPAYLEALRLDDRLAEWRALASETPEAASLG